MSAHLCINPASAYWGERTARAAADSPVLGIPVSAVPDLVRGLGFVKKAFARANAATGALDRKRAAAIVMACDELIDGRRHEQFIVDVIQGAAGAAINDNANEVIANLALETLGYGKGRHDVLHPLEHVNASQDVACVYPVAMRIALWLALDRLMGAVAALRRGFEVRALELRDVPRLQDYALRAPDALPLTLGREFALRAAAVEEDERHLREARARLQALHLCAAAVNAPIGCAALAARYLAEESRVPLGTGDGRAAVFVHLSGVLKHAAAQLGQICNDLRLMSPSAPALAEVVNQVALELIGNDTTVAVACQAGPLQRNAFEPLIGWSLFKSTEHLGRACRLALREHCVAHLEPEDTALPPLEQDHFSPVENLLAAA